MLTIKFKTDAPQFADRHGHEPARILRGIAEALDCGMTEGIILDDKRHRIGEWAFTPSYREA